MPDIARRFVIPLGGAAIVIGLLHGCANTPANDAEVRARAAAVMKSSFKARGQAQLDRLDQDETQRLCSEYANRPLPPSIADKIEKANRATIRLPADANRPSRQAPADTLLQ